MNRISIALAIALIGQIIGKTFVVSYSYPASESWCAEFSTNLVTWEPCTNERVDLTTGERSTSTGIGWAQSYFVRLRNLKL